MTQGLSRGSSPGRAAFRPFLYIELPGAVTLPGKSFSHDRHETTQGTTYPAIHTQRGVFRGAAGQATAAMRILATPPCPRPICRLAGPSNLGFSGGDCVRSGQDHTRLKLSAARFGAARYLERRCLGASGFWPASRDAPRGLAAHHRGATRRTPYRGTSGCCPSDPCANAQGSACYPIGFRPAVSGKNTVARRLARPPTRFSRTGGGSSARPYRPNQVACGELPRCGRRRDIPCGAARKCR